MLPPLDARELLQPREHPRANIHIPDGTLPAEKVEAFCAEYEQAIQAAGGIDLQILGIGRTGHIGFNEPGSPRDSRTRLIRLDRVTRKDAASDFFGEENVPQTGHHHGRGHDPGGPRDLPAGLRRAQGADRPPRRRGRDVRPAWPPASSRTHADATFYLDAGRGGRPDARGHALAGRPVPVGRPAHSARPSSGWRASSSKPILKLTDEDYAENGLADLLAERGRVRTSSTSTSSAGMMNTITGWPGGKRAGQAGRWSSARTRTTT